MPSASDGSRYHTAVHWICQVSVDYLGGPTLARLKIGERKRHDDHVAASPQMPQKSEHFPLHTLRGVLEFLDQGFGYG